MPSFDFASYEQSTGHAPRGDLAAAQRAAFEQIARPGAWWTGAQRVAFAKEVRSAWSQRNEPPWLRNADADEDASGAAGLLPATAIDVARRVAAEAHRLDRDWCDKAVAELGDAAYVELVSIAVCVVATDAFALALGVHVEPLTDPQPGEPERIRPDGMGDGGAWVEMTVPWPAGPNVARALSLSPQGTRAFFGLVGSMYALHDFSELVWSDRPLTRPQIEITAARVSAVNECFY